MTLFIYIVVLAISVCVTSDVQSRYDEEYENWKRIEYYMPKHYDYVEPMNMWQNT